jgi:hypothetical protein
LGLGLGVADKTRAIVGGLFVGCNVISTMIDLLMWCKLTPYITISLHAMVSYLHASYLFMITVVYGDHHRDVRITVTVIHVMSLFILFVALSRYTFLTTLHHFTSHFTSPLTSFLASFANPFKIWPSTQTSTQDLFNSSHAH